MGVIVQKYGGTSVADVQRLKVVAQQVVERKRAGHQLVVVVSAMGQTTDELIGMAREVSAEPSRRELNMLVTAGERISMALLSMAIQEQGEQAISFTGSQSGIITEDAHHNARIVEVTPFRIVEALQSGNIVIVAGYQGVSRAREITTLGRGGSDTTAVALAAALDAEACEIYSDVDGVYSADPRLCDQAKLIADLDYEAMQAMADAGARVLNAQAVAFAQRAGIVLHARKTADTSGRQSIVRAANRPAGFVAVVSAKHALQVYGASSQQLLSLAQLGGVTLAAAKEDCFVGYGELPDADPTPLVRVLEGNGIRFERVSLVTIVGYGLISHPPTLERLQQVLQQTGLCDDVCHMQPSNIGIRVAPDRCDTVVRKLHEHLIESPDRDGHP